jgi:hypothetical protein
MHEIDLAHFRNSLVVERKKHYSQNTIYCQAILFAVFQKPPIANENFDK